MKESYEEGLASHLGLARTLTMVTSLVLQRKTRVRQAERLSSENSVIFVCRPSRLTGKATLATP
jgi:hypothetical protein